MAYAPEVARMKHVTEHQAKIEQQCDQAKRDEPAAPARRHLRGRADSEGSSSQSRQKSPIANRLPTARIQIGQGRYLRAPHLTAVAPEPNEEGDDFVEHSKNREAHEADQCEKTVQVFELAGKG